MSAHEIIPPSPAGAADDTVGLRNLTPSRRHDGWTGERQRKFLEALSQGHSVANACFQVGLSEQSAYAFRRAARGASFALGWQAAQLLCREALADRLLDRALNGTEAVHHHSDGSETHYRKHDNHLAFKMLTRMDRLAAAAHSETTHAAARLVAGDFEQYLDLIGRDGGPARAGLFLGARLGAEGIPAGEDDLAPVRALARADQWLRTHTDLAEPLATADLDPGGRDDWSGEQWRRAEAAGMVRLAPDPDPEPEPQPAIAPENAQLPQHSGAEQAPVWFDDEADQWFTRFPPPKDFDGEEDGEYGDPGYSRELSEAELEVVTAELESRLAEQRARESSERDAWFAGEPAPGDASPEPDTASPAPAPAPARPQPVDDAAAASAEGPPPQDDSAHAPIGMDSA